MKRLGTLAGILVIVVIGLTSTASAAPPQAGGLYSGPGLGCVGSTLLATGCATQTAEMQNPYEVAVSRDGQTIYALTAYSGGTVVAMRRQPDGSIGAKLNCASAQPNPNCTTVIPALTNGWTMALGASGQLIVGSQYGMSGGITSVGTKPDGSIDSMLNCVATAGSGPWAGCSTRPGLHLIVDVAVGPGGTIYAASFSSYTTGTVIALGSDGNGAIGSELSCWSTTGSGPTYVCPTNNTTRIASPTGVIATETTLYVTSSEYQANYGIVTAFPLAPGGAIETPAGCVSDTGATYPTPPCGATAPGLFGARVPALSQDGRLYVGSSPWDGSKGSIAAFSLLASGGIGPALNCLGSDPSTGCPSAPGLRGVSDLTVAGDGIVYAASNYGATDGAATALGRQANGALSGVINCIGVSSGTGCQALTPGLAGANGIAGSPEPGMPNVYVASRFSNGVSGPGVDGALVPLAREIAPTCIDATVTTAIGRAVNITLPCSDPNRDPLTYTVVTGPSRGSLGPVDQAAGTVTYEPKAKAKGTDTFTVKAGDGTLESGVATVSVKVVPQAKVTNFKVAPKKFAVKKRRSATFRYRIDRPGRVNIQITRCKTKSKKSCAKRSLGSVTRTEKKAGKRQFGFNGKVRGKPLKPGEYRATIILTPSPPFAASQPRQAGFTVVSRKK